MRNSLRKLNVKTEMLKVGRWMDGLSKEMDSFFVCVCFCFFFGMCMRIAA